MKMKLKNRSVVDDVPYGLWVWIMPNGAIVMDEDHNWLNTVGVKGDTSGAFALAKAVRHYGITEGKPVFLPGHRRVDDEEFARQKFRMSLGLTPDEQDAGANADARRTGLV